MTRPIDAPTAAHLDRLYLAAHGLGAPFSCGGTIALKKPLALRFRDGARFVVAPPPGERQWSAQWLDPLLQHCERAPFGHKRATRYDHRVRDALQLRAERGALAVIDFDPAANGILEAVRAALVPDDPNPLTAELYCLNVYARGGHFVTHKDTPRGADMLGTLVVCLPVEFAGGDLALTHRGAEKTFSWSVKTASAEAPGELPWAAFFGDVDHEVQKVWSGHRITLTWLLRRGSGRPRSLAKSPATDPFDDALAAALADKGFLANGGTLGIRCEHQYSETPGFQRAIPALDARSVLKLKGRDQHVAAAVLAAGLEVVLKPFVIESDIEERWALERFPTEREARVFRSEQLTPEDIEDALPVESHVDPFTQDDRVRWVEPTSRESRKSTAGHTLLGATEYSATGYFGNEAGDAEFYLYAALLVTVPSRGKRPAKPVVKVEPEPVVKAKAEPVAKVKAKAPIAPPTGELMASELREMGYSPAALKKALADGSIVRASFGWYRIVRVPTAGDRG